MTNRMPPRSVEWMGGLDGHLHMLDQTKLPGTVAYIECRTPETVWEGIRRLSVRGAPAIGIAAAMGLVLGIRDAGDDREAFFARLRETRDYLASSRPTAVNLFWALDRMVRLAESLADQPVSDIKSALLDEAKRIRDEDADMCRAIGRHGLALVQDGDRVLTHCNAGSLATAEYGTALAPLYQAFEQGRSISVYVDETRPLLQGARLTAWELIQAGIDATLLCDNMAGMLMKEGKVTKVITGADRIAANGDVANKIGTYAVAVLAKAHGIPFYVAAPSSTFDMAIPNGDHIPIEYRDPEEIRRGFGTLTAPEDMPCYAPAFDVTPAALITALVTEKGIIQPVSEENIRQTLNVSAAS